MEVQGTTRPDPATELLASELTAVKASIELVSSGLATRITLTGLRFGRQLADRLGAQAAGVGVDVAATFWPEDDACDVRVSLIGLVDSDGADEAERG